MARVPVLDFQRQRVDPRGIGDHQAGEIGAVRGFAFRPAQMPHLHELGAATRQAEPAGADDGERAHARALRRGETACHHAAEGESRQVVTVGRVQQPSQARRQDRGHGARILGIGRRIGQAEARQIGRDHPARGGERRDVAHPVPPGPAAAVQQHQRRPGAPGVPDHPTRATGRFGPVGRLLQMLQNGVRSVVGQAIGHAACSPALARAARGVLYRTVGTGTGPRQVQPMDGS